jgi:stress response protein YsnF
MTAPTTGPGQDLAPEGSSVELELLEERLTAQSVRVPREVVRVSKRIRHETRLLEVEVRTEELVVERRELAGEQPGTLPDPATAWADEHEDLALVLHAEVPEVTLHVEPVERVTAKVWSVEGTSSVNAVLRSEVVEVEVAGSLEES